MTLKMRFLRNVPSTASTRSAFYFNRKPDYTATKCQAFGKYLWNQEERTVCNRTGKSWFLCISLYLLLLGILFGIFMGLLFGVVALTHYFGRGEMYNVSEIKNPNN